MVLCTGEFAAICMLAGSGKEFLIESFAGGFEPVSVENLCDMVKMLLEEGVVSLQDKIVLQRDGRQGHRQEHSKSWLQNPYKAGGRADNHSSHNKLLQPR